MNKDRIGGIVFAVIGLSIVIFTGHIRVTANLKEPGPRLFPYIAGFGMFICGIGIALSAKKEKEEKKFLTAAGWKRLVEVSAVLVLYYVGLQFLGFIISTLIFTAAVIYLLASGKKINKITVLIITVITTGLLYWLFEKMFAIPLPSGMLF